MQVFVNVLGQWIMPLFFTLSGASIYFSLNIRTVQQFLQERFTRLLIPLLFGILVLIPPQVYIERISDPTHGVAPWSGVTTFSGSFLEFYPYYFQGWYGFGGNFAWMGLHLWYLLILFIFSVLTLPLFLGLQQRLAAGISARVRWFLEQPGGIFLLALPVMWLEVGLDPHGLGIRVFGGWNLFIYLILMVYGYWMVADGRIERSLYQHGWIALILVICTTPILIYNWLTHSVDDAPFRALRALNSWCWIIGLLSLARSYLNFNHPALNYASQAAFPFYILHQTVIVMIGFFMAKWAVGMLPKFLLLSIASLMVILTLYEFLIRPWNGLRFLFGLKRFSHSSAKG